MQTALELKEKQLLADHRVALKAEVDAKAKELNALHAKEMKKATEMKKANEETLRAEQFRKTKETKAMKSSTASVLNICQTCIQHVIDKKNLEAAVLLHEAEIKMADEAKTTLMGRIKEKIIEIAALRDKETQVINTEVPSGNDTMRSQQDTGSIRYADLKKEYEDYASTYATQVQQTMLLKISA